VIGQPYPDEENHRAVRDAGDKKMTYWTGGYAYEAK
jgi:hypothetical protein